MSEVAQVRAKQSELYGAPLNEVLRRCSAALGLNQAQMAKLLGISAPMLSQLINGHRIKVANPTAAARLVALVQAADAVSSGEITVAQAVAAVGEADATESFTATTAIRPKRHLAADIQDVFRATAAAGDFIGAANAIRDEHPDVAELLVVYGAERADTAAAWTDQKLGR